MHKAKNIYLLLIKEKKKKKKKKVAQGTRWPRQGTNGSWLSDDDDFNRIFRYIFVLF